VNSKIETLLNGIFARQKYSKSIHNLTTHKLHSRIFYPASSLLSTEPSVSSVGHPLNRILCRLQREHLLEGLSLYVHENTSVDSQRLTNGCLGMRCRVNVFVT
jgi:hypothetical protein